MKVVVVGSGGREHALLWKLIQSKKIGDLYALPGNGGAARIAHQVSPGAFNVDDLVTAIRAIEPDLVVVGPEQPLAEGLTDRLRSLNIVCFGPSAAAARIEASKVFAKQLMHKHGIPTAGFEIFDDYHALEQHVAKQGTECGWVVKADGLAAGKGAFVCGNAEETLRSARSLLVDHALGDAGRTVVLEELLTGTEASAHYWCDGERFAAMPVARDYKRALDGDAGPNTGGMGTYCPARHVSSAELKAIEEIIVAPTLRAMAAEGAPYRGLLYVGLMLTDAGPKVIEYNCRFGDPETQVILPTVDYDIVDVMLDCARGSLRPERIPSAAARAAVCVVMAAEGYPAKYEKGILLKEVNDSEHAVTFHAGTRLEHDELRSSGGRVLNAVGVAEDLTSARAHAYDLAARLRVPGLRYRSDIAESVVEVS